jgi:hypothetical protein
MKNGLDAARVAPIIFWKGVFTSGTLYLCSDIMSRTWDGHTWLGAGKYVGVGDVSERGRVEANGVTFYLNVVDPDILGKVLGECRQGNDVQMWFGLLDVDTGAIIADPAEAWLGKMDTVHINEDPARPTVALTVESPFIQLKKGVPWRWTDQDTQSRHPGDLACQYVPELQNKQLTWGSATISSGGSGSFVGPGCFGPTVRLPAPNAVTTMAELYQQYRRDGLVVASTHFGPRAADMFEHFVREEMLDMGDGELVTLDHPIRLREGFLLGDFGAARLKWSRRVAYVGPVYDLRIRTEREEERHFRLANGETPHNKMEASEGAG